MNSRKSIFAYAAFALLAAFAMSAPTAAQAKHRHHAPAKHVSAKHDADKSTQAGKVVSTWRRLGDRTNKNGDTLEIWTGHDEATSDLPKNRRQPQKTTDRFILVKHNKDGTTAEIVLGKLPNRFAAGEKPVEFATLAAHGVIVSTVTLGSRKGELVPVNNVRSDNHGRRASGKKFHPTAQQFAALNHLFNAISRSEAVLKSKQTGNSVGEAKSAK